MATLACASRTATVVAVDYSFDSLAVLKRKATNKNILLVQADITRLPFRDNVFDYALCANALQHIKPGRPQERAIEELSRVTRPNGRIVVSVHHFSRSKRKRNWTKEGRPGQSDIDYIFRFARQDLRALTGGSLSAVGFYGLQRFPGVGVKVQNAVARVFGRIAAIAGFGHMLIAVVRKSTGGA
jgi:SAM-dependent methyltransferase